MIRNAIAALLVLSPTCYGVEPGIYEYLYATGIHTGVVGRIELTNIEKKESGETLFEARTLDWPGGKRPLRINAGSCVKNECSFVDESESRKGKLIIRSKYKWRDTNGNTLKVTRFDTWTRPDKSVNRDSMGIHTFEMRRAAR